MKKTFIPLLLILVLCFQTVVLAVSEFNYNGNMPYWVTNFSFNEKYGYHICYDSYESPSIDKNKQLYNYIYGIEGYYYYSFHELSGYLSYNLVVFVPDEVTQSNIDSGCELILFPSGFQYVDSERHTLSSFYYIKDNEFIRATGSFYQIYNTGNKYTVLEISTLNAAYYDGYTYNCSVKMYLDDYSTYETLNDIRNSILNGDLPPLNEADFLPKKYGVIEPPQDMRLTDDGLFSDNMTTFTWTQTDKNYKLWETEIMIHADLGYKLTIDFFGSFNRTGNLLLKTDVIKTSDMHYSVVLVELVQECRYVYQDIIIEKYGDWLGTHVQLQNCTFSFRNKYFDGQYTYYSNWVKVYIDENEDYAIEYEYDDKINGDKDVDYTTTTPSGVVNDNSPYQGDSIKNGSTITNITDFISNGFGLLGNNGIVGMVQHIFSYVPTWIWSLIGSGIGVLIIITIIKLAL